MANAEGLIELSTVFKKLDLTRSVQSAIVKEGLVTPVARGPHGRYLVTKEDAIFVSGAAALALAAGIAIVSMIRMLRVQDAQVDLSAITIPIKGLV